MPDQPLPTPTQPPTPPGAGTQPPQPPLAGTAPKTAPITPPSSGSVAPSAIPRPLPKPQVLTPGTPMTIAPAPPSIGQPGTAAPAKMPSGPIAQSSAPLPGQGGQALPEIKTQTPVPTPPAKPPTPAAPPLPPTTPAPTSLPPVTPATLPKPAAPMPPPVSAPMPAPKPVAATGMPAPTPPPSPANLPATPPKMPPAPMTGAVPPTAPPAQMPPSSAPGAKLPGLPTSTGPTAPGTPPGTPPPPPAGTTTVNTTTTVKPAGNATFAKIQKSPLRFLPFILGGLVILGVIGYFLMRIFGGATPEPVTTGTNGTANNNTSTTGRTAVPATQTTLTYWGLWEPSEVLEEVLTDFETANPGIQVEYVKQSHKDYRDRLQNGIASGSGPDVFRFHASWVPMIKAELAPMPASVMSASEYQQSFYPVATKQLQVNGQIVGVPLMYDGLALYYNEEILKTAGVQPPTTWAEVRTLATQLTVRNSTGKIERSGLAAGTAGNVEHFSDILGLLLLQNGADSAKPTSKEAQDALTFYTNFAKVDKVWDSTLPASTVAFARGEAAMMFAPSWRAHEVKATNPNLKFGIAQLPKLGSSKTSWGSYWAEGVSSKSKNKDAAWKLIDFLSSKENMKKLYSEQSQIRAFGEPYSRIDMASELAADPYVAAYLKDAPNADSWYLNSFTHDNGINDLTIKYYEDAINAVLAGKTAEEALQTVNSGTTQVMRQYGVTTAQ